MFSSHSAKVASDRSSDTRVADCLHAEWFGELGDHL